MKDYLRSRRRIFCILAPGLIGLLYMILCFVNLHQSIWYDESYSAYLTHFDFAGIWKYTAADVHPPLYYSCLKHGRTSSDIPISPCAQCRSSLDPAQLFQLFSGSNINMVPRQPSSAASCWQFRQNSCAMAKRCACIP